MKYDVFTVGDPTLDLIFTDLPQVPCLGEDTLAKGFGLAPGEAYNTAVALHRLGISVAWAADFGNDQISQLILSMIRNDHMDESFFVHHERPFRRLSASFSFPEERGFLSFYDPSPTIPAGVAALQRVDAKVCFIPGLLTGSMFQLALPIIRLKKMTLFMDGNCNTEVSLKDRSVKQTLKNLDVFLPNQSEACQITGFTDLIDAGKALHELCPMVIVKAGKDGSYAFTSDQVVHQPAIEVNPIDTTGAGDVFDAGFLAAWLENKPMQECLRWGNIAAGLSTKGYGSSGYLVNREELERLLN